MDHARLRITEAGGAAEAAALGAARPQPLLDRARLAAIIQQVPSESYHLTMRRRDPATGQMRWQIGEVGNVDGLELLSLLDHREACLHLRDIDWILERFDIEVPDTPIAPPTSHRLRHGLMFVSPHSRACPGSTEGEGAIRILSGRALLLPEPDELLSTRHDQIPAFEAGAVLPWHTGPAPMLQAGDEMLVALTYEALPKLRFGEIRGAVARAAALVGSPFATHDGRHCRMSGPAEFRLVRSRSGHGSA